MHAEQHPGGLGCHDLLIDKGIQRRDVHEGAVQHLRSQDLHLGQLLGTFGRDQLNGDGVVSSQHDRLLVGVEVIVAHGDHFGLRVGAPSTHAVRVRTCEVLHRGWRATIGVAFTQYRVHRTAQRLAVAGPSVLLSISARVVQVIGQREAQRLQFSDSRLQLRHRSRDVGQLDDVGFRLLGECTQLGEGIGLALSFGKQIGEGGQDPAGEGDVAGLNFNSRSAGECLNDRQERVSRQHWRLIGIGVDDLGHSQIPSGQFLDVERYWVDALRREPAVHSIPPANSLFEQNFAKVKHPNMTDPPHCRVVTRCFGGRRSLRDGETPVRWFPVEVGHHAMKYRAVFKHQRQPVPVPGPHW